MPSLKRPKSTLAQMALSSNYYALKVQRLDKILAHKAVSSNGNFLQGHPKPEFSEKVQRGHQGKFFKNRPKSSFRWKGPKVLLRNWPYARTSMHLKCKDWRRFWGKKAAPKVPE